MNVIEVDRACAGYGGEPVLRDISLSLKEGDLAGLLGPNGSGKSTLFRMLGGALKPSSGGVRVMGRDVSSFGASELGRIMAVLPQFTDEPFGFSAFEAACMGRYPHSGRFSALSARDIEAVEEAMALVDVIHLRGRLMNTLSGGERRRVLLAQALAQEPKILLLDEPSAHLDVQHQVELFELLCKVNERGITVLAILHDLNLAAQYLRRILFLKQGAIIADGPPAEVVNGRLIESAFGIRLDVLVREGTDKPSVLYSRAGTSGPAQAPIRIHVICGGGTGRGIMGMLAQQGHELSAGVLNRGDSDEVFARNIGAAVVQAPPFSAIPEEAHAENLRLLRGANLVILCPVPVGPGNLRNLEAVRASQAGGAAIAVLEEAAISDHAGGEATRILREILNNGAARFATKSALADYVRTISPRRECQGAVKN